MLPLRAVPPTSSVPEPEIVRLGLVPKAVRLPALRTPEVALRASVPAPLTPAIDCAAWLKTAVSLLFKTVLAPNEPVGLTVRLPLLTVSAGLASVPLTRRVPPFRSNFVDEL